MAKPLDKEALKRKLQKNAERRQKAKVEREKRLEEVFGKSGSRLRQKRMGLL